MDPTYTALIFTVSSGFLTILITVAGLFVWNRAEGRADARKAEERDEQLRNTMAANALECRKLIDTNA